MGGSGTHGAVEPFDLPDVQGDLCLVGRGQEIIGLGRGGGDRLLHQDPDAPPQHVQPDLVMGGGDDGAGHTLHLAEQRVEVGVRGGADLVGHLFGAGGVPVVDPDELRVGILRQVTRVMAPERTDAHHSDRHPDAHAGTPRWEFSTNWMNCSTSGNGGRSARARSVACDRVRSELK